MMTKDPQRFFFWGRPFSPLYGLAMSIRARLYKNGFLSSQKLPVPVISVGNLVLGGTGKTPVVRHLGRLLADHGYRPAIVSRGYKGKAKASVNIVADTDRVVLEAHMGGDEPVMLATQLPGIPVLTGKKRAIPARYAIHNFAADTILLDDGFQHLGLRRDIDLVLFDATNLAGNSRIFPGGVLREPIAALKRCDAFLITSRTTENADRASRFADLLRQRFPTVPIFFSELSGYHLTDVTGKDVVPPPGAGVYAFCGIANPQRFASSLKEIGVRVTGISTFADHIEYTQDLVESLRVTANKTGVGALITTAKDAVKLQGISIDVPVLVLHIQHTFPAAFNQFILDRLQD